MRKLICGALFSILLFSCSNSGNIADLNWLVGSWSGEDVTSLIFHESWIHGEKNSLNGYSFTLSPAGDTLFHEPLKVDLVEGVPFYYATLPKSKEPILYKLIESDATHAASMTKILSREMGIRVSCAGTYCKNESDWFREQVHGYCDEILITDDHTQVGDLIARIEPAAIFGTQMERHIGQDTQRECRVVR